MLASGAADEYNATILREELDNYFLNNDSLAILRNPNEQNRRFRGMQFVRERLEAIKASQDETMW